MTSAPEIFIPKKPPVFTYKPLPDFKTPVQRQRYYEKEKRYWIEGWNHLTGPHYHYLSQQKIKDRVSGKIIRPRGREGDMMVFEEIRDCMDKYKCPSFMPKARGFGLTSIGGSLIHYTMRVHPGSTCLVTSADQARISKLYEDKIKVTQDHYHSDLKYRVSKFNQTTSKTYMQLEVKYMESGEVNIAYSDMFCNQTNDSDTAASSFSGTGAKLGFYDELALNKRRKKLLQSSVECYRNQNTMEMDGFLLSGGTIEDVLGNEEITEMWNLINSAEAYRMRVFFIPYSWKFTDDNGYIDFARAEKWWNAEYDRLSKIEDDTSHLTSFLKNNPRTLDDIFEMAKGGFFEDDVADKISAQLASVRKDKTIIEVPSTIVKKEDGYEATPAKNGKWLILEPPLETVEYVATVDGVASGKKTGGEKGSRVATLIWKMFDPRGFSFCPVALYYSRPNEVEQSYIYTIEGCHYYDRWGLFKKIAAEGNAGTSDHFSTFLRKEGLGKWILYSKDLTGKGNIKTGKPFQYVNAAVQDWQIKQLNIFLRKHVTNIRMATVLQDFLKSKVENADIRSSALMFPVYTGANFDNKTETRKTIKHVRPHIITTGDGRTVRVWK